MTGESVGGSTKSKSATGQTQRVTYIKRHPSFTREEFWKYWQTEHAPRVALLAAHFNINRYQQIQVGGKILPTAPEADGPSSTELVDFDGIAMFLYESPEALVAMLSHPYYVNAVAVDEARFIGKSAPGSGFVAMFVGTNIEVMDRADDVWVGDQEQREKFQQLLNSYL